MKAEQIVVGGVYLIKHHGDLGLTEVRVDKIEEHESYCGYNSYSRQPQYRTTTRYRCTKLSTGRAIIVKSAAKFRCTSSLLDRTMKKVASNQTLNNCPAKDKGGPEGGVQ